MIDENILEKYHEDIRKIVIKRRRVDFLRAYSESKIKEEVDSITLVDYLASVEVVASVTGLISDASQITGDGSNRI